MPDNTNLNLSSGKKVSYSKPHRSQSWLMFLLSSVLAGAVLAWLASIWYSYDGNKELFWSSYNALADQWLQLNDRWTATQKTVAIKEAANTPVAQTDANSWRQTMQAIEELNKQAGNSDNDPSYHNHLGVLYAQARDYSTAIKQFNQAVLLCRRQIWQQNSTPSNSSSLFVELSSAHSNLAKIYDRLGDHNRVIAELEELNRDLAFANSPPSCPTVAIQKTTVLVTQNNGLTPEEAAMFAKAEALRQVGQLPEAMQEYRNLIALKPDFALAHQRLGLTAIAANDLGLATNELQIAITLDNKDPDTYNDLGLVYRQLGDYQAAKQCFGQAHYIDPKHLSAAMNFADSLSSMGSLAAALNVMRQTAIDHPTSPAAHNDLAALYARIGNDKAAAKEFAQTLSLNSGLASAHYGLGVASLNLKSYPQAITELETAKKLNPGILDLQNRLDLANSNNSKELASAQGIEY